MNDLLADRKESVAEIYNDCTLGYLAERFFTTLTIPPLLHDLQHSLHDRKLSGHANVDYINDNDTLRNMLYLNILHLYYYAQGVAALHSMMIDNQLLQQNLEIARKKLHIVAAIISPGEGTVTVPEVITNKYIYELVSKIDVGQARNLFYKINSITPLFGQMNFTNPSPDLPVDAYGSTPLPVAPLPVDAYGSTSLPAIDQTLCKILSTMDKLHTQVVSQRYKMMSDASIYSTLISLDPAPPQQNTITRQGIAKALLKRFEEDKSDITYDGIWRGILVIRYDPYDHSFVTNTIRFDSIISTALRNFTDEQKKETAFNLMYYPIKINQIIYSDDKKEYNNLVQSITAILQGTNGKFEANDWHFAQQQENIKDGKLDKGELYRMLDKQIPELLLRHFQLFSTISGITAFIRVITGGYDIIIPHLSTDEITTLITRLSEVREKEQQIMLKLTVENRREIAFRVLVGEIYEAWREFVLLPQHWQQILFLHQSPYQETLQELEDKLRAMGVTEPLDPGIISTYIGAINNLVYETDDDNVLSPTSGSLFVGAKDIAELYRQAIKDIALLLDYDANITVEYLLREYAWEGTLLEFLRKHHPEQTEQIIESMEDKFRQLKVDDPWNPDTVDWYRTMVDEKSAGERL